ncbi:MAG: cytochrome c3 family protein [Thermodesulfobacteriota bacterium]
MGDNEIVKADAKEKKIRLLLITAVSVLLVFGCGKNSEYLLDFKAGTKEEEVEKSGGHMTDYYDQFYRSVVQRASMRSVPGEAPALGALPKDTEGRVNWTASVIGGFINPRGTLDPKDKEKPPLDLNIFIEAKVPLMANVIFPHSIHSYWLKCSNCHPKIFIPEAGANPITMDEIWQGKWCGRCHGKVAFTYWPRANCLRCHSVLKGRSIERETWK